MTGGGVLYSHLENQIIFCSFPSQIRIGLGSLLVQLLGMGPGAWSMLDRHSH